MVDPKISVPIRNINSSLQGPSLEPEISHCFEEAYASFVSQKLKQKEMKEKIDEMGNLLTVSLENLDTVKNQKWFNRAWQTITGKNKKLERVNQENLLKVQKGALYFIQNLAELNEEMMATVARTLQRIEDIQKESTKLKGYLIKLVQKYNKKLGHIENKLDQHDKAIRYLQHTTGRNIYLIFGIIILVIGVVSFLVAPTDYKWFISILFILLSIPLFISFFRGSQTFLGPITNSKIKETLIVNENNKIIPQICEIIYSSYADFVNTNLLTTPYKNFFDKNEKLSKLYLELNANQSDKPKYAADLKKILSIEPETINIIENNLRKCSNTFCEYHRQLVASMQNDYIPNSIGIDVLSSLDFNFQSQLANELVNAIVPYSSQFDHLSNTRKNLLSQFTKFEKLMNESVLIEYGKAIWEGFTLGLMSPNTDDVNFVNGVVDNLALYGQQWDNITPIIQNSVIQLNANTYDGAIRSSINTMQPLFDEFNEQKISLIPLLKQLRNGKE